MHRLIASWTLSEETFTIGGHIWPDAVLLSDDDGVLIFATASPEIPTLVWTDAEARGASIVAYANNSQVWAITTEDFLAHRRHLPVNSTFGMPEDVTWIEVTPDFTYRSFLDAKDEQTAPTEAENFVHLHTHSEFSALDGLTTVQEMVDRAVEMGQPAIAITDHGVCSAHPQLQKVAAKAGIKPIFGVEAYLVDDRLFRPKSAKPPTPLDEKDLARWREESAAEVARARSYYHLILWAQTDEGLRNLWAMTTEANRTGSYYVPRMDWDLLAQYGEGVMCSTACLHGPLAYPLNEHNDEGLALSNLGRLQAIFPDRLYVELHTTSVAEQKPVNEWLVSAANKHGLPLIAVTDSHYCLERDQSAHDVWIAIQTNKDLQDENYLFAGHHPYHLMSRAEAVKSLSYLPASVVNEALDNTVEVADRCTATVSGKSDPPIYSKKGSTKPERVVDDVSRLVDLCVEHWDKTYGKTRVVKGVEVPITQDEYLARFETEMNLLKEKGFCGYFLMVADYCLDPSTPVLTEDLRWVEVGKLEVGDRLAGFDEHKILKESKSHRYWRSAQVVNTKRITLPTYRIVLDDGTETITSEDHQWLVSSPSGSKTRWVRTRDLRVGQRPQRLVEEWDEPGTWEAGYLAGIFDGEGSLSHISQANGGRSMSLGFAQKEGVVLDTALRILDAWGFSYSVTDHGAERNGLRSVWIKGGRSEIMRLLGMVRPQRLLEKLHVDDLGRVTSIDTPAITQIEPLGLGEVVALETTTGTLVAQGFAHHNCLYAKTHNILVGPGRGSGGGCLVAYLCGITEIDPVEADLLFERFLNPGRNELPDFDVDFPASKREEMTNYLIDRWGEEFVIRVGTHVRLKNKGIFRDLERVLKSTIEIHHPDIEAISKVIERAEADSAGLGYKWADILSTHEDEFKPFVEKYPALFNYAGRLTGRLKTYGKHPAGIVISPDEPILNRLPMWFSKDGMPITEFDMDALTALGLVKFDILTIRTLDTIQMTMDLIEEHTGKRVNIYEWREEYADPVVWDTISAGNTLGMFQIETHAVTRLCKRLGPRNLSELSDVITLVRPGPVKSGLTETYFRRRNGDEAVTYPHPDLATVLDKTYGCMLYQEDIMNVCRVIGGYSLEEADGVRKILGKKKVDEAAAAGAIFIERSVANGYEKQLAEDLWRQMEEFAKYSFNRSHAWGYAMLSHWTAWLKVHYPIEFITAILSTIDKNRIPEFVQECRRLDIKVLPPDVNLSGSGFRGHIDRKEIRYGLDGVMGVGEAKVKAIEEHQPYVSFADFLDRSGVDSGITRTLVTIGAFDSLHPNRAALIETLDWQTSDASSRCDRHGPIVTVGNDKGENWSLPCTYDWSEEPVEIGPSGRAKKRKAPPKRCTKACRQYVAPTPPERDFSIPNEMTPEQIMAIEKEYLGMYLTVTPFDFFPPNDLVNFSTLEAIEAGLPGNYGIAAVIEGVRVTFDRHQREMAFLNLTLHDGGSLRVPAFSKQWAAIKEDVWEGRLIAAVVEKQSGIHGGCIFAHQEDSSLPAYYPISN